MTTPLPGTADLLSLWDDASAHDPAGRALVLARATAEDIDQSELACGHIHARVLELRARLLGDAMTVRATCSGCGADVEVSLPVSDLLPLEEKIVDDPPPVRHGGWTVHWRPPTVTDLRAAARHNRPEDAAAALLRRCVRDARDATGAAVRGDRLPVGVRTALATALEDADPLAEVMLEPTCPGCGQPFLVDLDVVDFVWTEVDRTARALLLEVDCLARAYGWTEAQVLALSPARRAAYLGILTDGGS